MWDDDIYIRIVYLPATTNPGIQKTFIVYRVDSDRAYWPRSYVPRQIGVPRPDFEESTTIEHMVAYIENVAQHAPSRWTKLTLEYRGEVHIVETGEQYAPTELSTNLARLMIRRHLRSWINAGSFTEDELVPLFIRVMTQYPDWKMQRISALVDGACRRAMDAESPRQNIDGATKYLEEALIRE